MLTVGSLFAGIGGMELGLEMTGGFETVWQVENDEYARKILAKHWPNVARWDDVRTFPPACDWDADVICGGFPCQDISKAGRRAGIDGKRSGLWSEFARIVRVVRPRFVIVENVAALLGRGIGRVVGDLAASGYDVQWDCIPAFAVGAPHERDRVFIVADANGQRRQKLDAPALAARAGFLDWSYSPHGTYAECVRQAMRGQRQALSATGVNRLDERGRGRTDSREIRLGWTRKDSAKRADAKSRWQRQLRWLESTANRKEEWHLYRTGGESPVPRVAHGVSHRLDRLRRLGNAVVPQIAEWIGYRILDAEQPS